MKNVFLVIILVGMYRVLHSQPSVPVKLREVKQLVGESITVSPMQNSEARTYRLSAYQTPDGGKGTLLQYDRPEANIPASVFVPLTQIKVQPNPTNGLFKVSITNNAASAGQLCIYDVLGVVQYSNIVSTSTILEIDLS